jgi:predicted GNAT family acetyltransferase
MEASEASVEVADAPERERYEIGVDGVLAGFAGYRARPGRIAFLHTQIDDRFRGRGLADRLIGFALDDARARGLAVLPYCPFVRSFIERHRDYLALVPADDRDAFGL